MVKSLFIRSLLVGLLALGMLSTASFYLFKKQSLFDDSFIYLHIAANIVESGTARYFPVSDSEQFLASSPLRLMTLIPGFILLDWFEVPLRTIKAARFTFLTSGFVAFLLFLPFWINRVKIYTAVSAAFFLLGASLDSLFLMEGGVLFFSLATLIKLLTEGSERYITVGVVVVLVGLSRPEIGVVAAIATFSIYYKNIKALINYITGLASAFAIYWIFMIILKVYPIPSTIWSKQITGKLKLFEEPNLIEILPLSISNYFGINNKWLGWIFIIIPVLFSIPMKKVAIPCIFSIGILLLISNSMPGNYVWYTENYLITIFVLGFGVAVELYKHNYTRSSYILYGILGAFYISLLAKNFGVNKPYPWNENSPAYRAYQEIGKSVTDKGEYIIKRYSNNPVHIRMCEIGIVSYYSGKSGWIYDLCGLVQIGNLKGASDSWLRYLYPAKFMENGDDQLKRFENHDKLEVIDVWALRTKEEAKNAQGKCKYMDDIFCINTYK